MNSKYLIGLVPALALGFMMSFSERVSSEETKLEKAETVKKKLSMLLRKNTEI
ncbi:MAG TPA: hypothetical protein PLJ21_05735 [Pseudobdellovibrionaceae bacterium]|nr:hypothetical protein [Pseudobdellovibrionaceae bacterium]